MTNTAIILKPAYTVAKTRTVLSLDECASQESFLPSEGKSVSGEMCRVVIDATHSGTVRGKHLPGKGRECGEEGQGEKETLTAKT